MTRGSIDITAIKDSTSKEGWKYVKQRDDDILCDARNTHWRNVYIEINTDDSSWRNVKEELWSLWKKKDEARWRISEIN